MWRIWTCDAVNLWAEALDCISIAISYLKVVIVCAVALQTPQILLISKMTCSKEMWRQNGHRGECASAVHVDPCNDNIC
jgi:hypothetical protein